MLIVTRFVSPLSWPPTPLKCGFGLLVYELCAGSVSVTTGAVVSYVTELSVDVEAVFGLPTASKAEPAGTLAVTVPSVMPLTATVYTLGPPLTTATLVPPDVPPSVTSEAVKPETGSLNVTVKLIGDAFVGSAWPEAWLAVTVAETLSIVYDSPLKLPLPAPVP